MNDMSYLKLISNKHEEGERKKGTYLWSEL
jgi:hypothetical protein